MDDNQLTTLIAQLESDNWRDRVGFSEDMQAALSETLNPSATDEHVIAVLEGWLGSKHQPCLFGRAAAKKHLLSFCILREQDLASDNMVRDKIQAARLLWRQRAFRGESSGFVIAVVSPKLVYATPNSAVRDIALRISSLYLDNQNISTDKILYDSIYLEQPGYAPRAWEWLTGVNYFSAQADKRWWQDHRIPAGLAFSVNSVGHMVRSGRLSSNLHDLDTSMDAGDVDPDFRKQRIDTLEQALTFAMQTISLASETPSGRATELLPKDTALSPSSPRCPVQLPPSLADKNHCTYRGRYHTDVTLPSEYFVANVDRPADLPEHILDFTYLFDKSITNPDYIKMGEGRRIRDDKDTGTTSGSPGTYRFYKRLRAAGAEVDLRNVPSSVRMVTEESRSE